MMTHHHRFPKVFRFRSDKFFYERSRSPILEVSSQDHRAWNTLTNNSKMTLQDIASSLSRFIPDDFEFICVPRKKKPDNPNQMELPLGFS